MEAVQVSHAIHVARIGSMVMPALFASAFLGFWALVAFTLVSVARWANRARRGSEEYYKTSALAKIAEMQEAAGEAAPSEWFREQEKAASKRRREGQKLGGMVTAAIGIALMIFLRSLPSPAAQQSFLVGLIPLFMGIALLSYAFLLAPKD
jgi:hypothetical protein